MQGLQWGPEIRTWSWSGPNPNWSWFPPCISQNPSDCPENIGCLGELCEAATVHHCCAGTGKDVAGETAASWGRFCRCCKATREGSGGGGEGTQGEAGTVGLLAPGPGHHSPWLWQAQLGSNYTISSCEMLHFILASSCSNKCFTTENIGDKNTESSVDDLFLSFQRNSSITSITSIRWPDRLSKIISMKFQSFLILLKSPELLPSNRQPKTTPEFKILY